MRKPKLLLIGWDAADWKVIDPLIKAGKMPALQSLLDRGARGNIATLNPVLSPMLWTSIATGKRAYNHGVHGFVEADPVTGTISPIKGTSRKVKAVWSILNEAGYKSNVVNWWPSHPAEKVNGAFISNHYHQQAARYGQSWPLERAAVYPDNHYEKLKELRLHPEELTRAHVEPFIPNAAHLKGASDKILTPFLRVLAQCSSVHNAATYLMEETEWDFMAVYHEAIDHFSHLAMKYHPPRLADVSEEDFNNYKSIVEGAYIFHDMMLGRMIDLAGSDCNIMLISDHGFESGSQRQVKLPDIPAAPAVEHRQYGVFVAAGPDIDSNKVFGASLLDITPSLLHLFGLPVGEDMEGRVLHSIFKSKSETSTIPSWEDTAEWPKFVEAEETTSAQMLAQLQDLGYIDLAQDDKLKYVDSELTYNLCVSYLDGNKPDQALPILERYFANNSELRYGLLLAQTYLKTGELELLDSHLSKLEKQFIGQGAVYFFRGLFWLQKNEHQKALDHFLKMEDRGLVSSQLYNDIARTFLIVQNHKAATNYFNKALELDAENAVSLGGMAQCKLEQGNAEEAFLLAQRSLRLQYFQPNTHFIVAMAAREMEEDEVSEKAVRVCLSQAPNHAAAKALLATLTNADTRSGDEEIIVVSGFPRSGTSMVMRMLDKGGIPVFSDAHRKADDNNPQGYYEHENVKQIGRQNEWLKEARGMALKVVSPLLRYLPATEVYRIIWINRPLTEVLISQEVMRGEAREEVMKSFPFQKAVDMQQEEERVKKWINMQPNMQLLEIDFYDCLQQTNLVISKIESFLKKELPHQKVKDAINKKLHRNKLGNY